VIIENDRAAGDGLPSPVFRLERLTHRSSSSDEAQVRRKTPHKWISAQPAVQTGQYNACTHCYLLACRQRTDVIGFNPAKVSGRTDRKKSTSSSVLKRPSVMRSEPAHARSRIPWRSEHTKALRHGEHCTHSRSKPRCPVCRAREAP